MVRTRRQSAVIAAQRGELITSAFEHSAVREYVGKDRYLQLAVSKSLGRAYSSRFGPLTSQKLSNLAAEAGELTLLDWAASVGCNWDASVFSSAMKGESTETLQHLLDNNCPMPEGGDACAFAASEVGLEILMWLREREFDWGEAVCTNAAANGHLLLLQWALEHGCPCAFVEVFKKAAYGGHVHILEWGEEIGAEFDESICAEAAAGGSLTTLQWLRARNSPWNENVVFNAIYCGHCDVFIWAKTHGCPYDVNWLIDGGVMYLEAAILGGFPDIARLLLADGALIEHAHLGEEHNSLPLAVGLDRYEIALDLINAGANIDVKDENEKTPLWIAARRGHAGMVDLLLKKGADMWWVDERGLVPMMVGAVLGHLDVVRTFLDAGADPNYETQHGRTALALALCNGRSEVAQFLADWGATLTPDAMAIVIQHSNYSEVDLEKFSRN